MCIVETSADFDHTHVEFVCYNLIITTLAIFKIGNPPFDRRHLEVFIVADFKISPPFVVQLEDS